MPKQEAKKKYLFVLNPRAGAGNEDVEDLREEIEASCKQRNLEHQTYKLRFDEDIEVIKGILKDFQPDIVVAGGGDGTVSILGSLLINTSICLGIIPMGSANGLAKNLKLPKRISPALQTVFENNVRKIDTLRVNGRTCLHLSDLGFNARIVKKFNRGDVRGMLAYTWWMFKEYFKYLPHHYGIAADEKKVFSGKAFMITITNFRKFGSNFTINPEANMDDGIFEIVVLKPFPFVNALKILMLIFKRDIDIHPFRKIIHAKQAVLDNPNEASFHIDGEPMLPKKKIKVEVLPKSLNVIVPKHVQK